LSQKLGVTSAHNWGEGKLCPILIRSFIPPLQDRWVKHRLAWLRLCHRTFAYLCCCEAGNTGQSHMAGDAS